MLQKITKTLDRINHMIGRAVSWLVLAMVVMMFVNVVGRYVFNATPIWQQELVGFMHAVVFLAASGYTLLCDKHVRVDAIYQRLSDKTKAIINMVGVLVLLLPVCCAVIYFSYDFVLNSWQLFEGSAEYNGLGGVFILKTFIWVFAFSLILQGVSMVCRSIIILRSQ